MIPTMERFTGKKDESETSQTQDGERLSDLGPELGRPALGIDLCNTEALLSNEEIMELQQDLSELARQRRYDAAYPSFGDETIGI